MGKFTLRTIDKNKLKLHSHVKYLGTLIDEVLSWNKQIASICMKLRVIFYKTLSFWVSAIFLKNWL